MMTGTILRNGKARILLVGAVLLGTMAVLFASPAALADPTFGVMNASGGIYWRSAPDWNTPEAIAGNGFYPDTIVAAHCYQSGAANVPGSTDSMWEQATDVGGSGTGSGWINEHFINDGSGINQPSPGVPSCASTPPPPTPGPLPAGEFSVMNASGGIYWRSAPDWNTAEAVAGNGFYPDTIITVSCYQAGAADVPGSTDSMWEQASVASGSGTGSGWINEHFINDGAAINQPSPGIPPCSTSPPPTTTSTPTPTTPTSTSLTFTVDNAAGGIYYRNSPHWADTSQTPGVGVYDGDSVQLICAGSGDPVGPYNNTAWSYVNNLSRNVGDGWVSEHFIDDGAPNDRWPAGESSCGASVPGSPTASGGSTPSQPTAGPGNGPASVFYSPNNDPTAGVGAGAIADLNIPLAGWTTDTKCGDAEAADIPAGVSTLAGWSVGRLGPIYFLAAASAAQKAQVHRIILFDPGDTTDFVSPGFPKDIFRQACDQNYNINALLVAWLGLSPSNRLTVLTGLDSEEKTGGDQGRSTFAGLWKYYFAGIWNQPFAWKAQVCDYDGMGHPEVLKNFAYIVNHPPPGPCPAGANLTPWNP